MAKCLFPKYKTTARNPLKDNIWELAAGNPSGHKNHKQRQKALQDKCKVLGSP